MHWQMKLGNAAIAVDKFLATGAPLPDGDKMLGRWHAPGSQKGWIIIETDNLHGVYEHAAEWGEIMTWEVTPVITDEEAGAIQTKLTASK